MDLVTGIPVSSNEKHDIYNYILVIVNKLTRMVSNELVKAIFDTLGLAKVSLDVKI